MRMIKNSGPNPLEKFNQFCNGAAVEWAGGTIVVEAGDQTFTIKPGEYFILHNNGEYEVRSSFEQPKGKA